MTDARAPGPLQEATSSPGISLHAFLTRLIWFCVLPLLLLAAWLAVDSVRSRQAEIDQEANHLAKSVAISIDQLLRARIGTLYVLSMSPQVDDASRWKDLYAEALGFHRRFGSHVILASVGEPMRMLFNTRVPFGAQLPPLPRPKGKAAAPAAVASGQPAVGDVFFGPVAKEPLIAIAMPVLRNDKAAYLLLTAVETALFQKRIDQVALPDGWSLSVVDGKNETIARRVPPGLNPGTDVDAAGRFVVKSNEAPWSVVLEISRGAYRAPLLTAAGSLLIAVLVATLVSVLGGMVASRRLAAAVTSLAVAPAPGGRVPHIVEIDAVRQQLKKANENRRIAEATLDQSEARFAATFEQAAVGIALVAPDGSWLRVNHKLCEILGYSREELLAKSFQDITHADDLGADLAQMRRMLAGEIDHYSMEKRYIDKDGGVVWINLTVALTWKAGGEPDYFISVVEDIRARRAAERALADAQAATIEDREQARLAALNQMEDAIAARASAEAAAAEVYRLNADLERRVVERTAELTAANAELDSFAYAVSHDLRAPLRALRGFSDALIEDHGDQLEGEAKVYLEQIDIASRRMGELIEGMLALSRSTRGELRSDAVDVSALATRLLDDLARSDPQRQVQRRVEAGLAVTGDARMIEVLMENLLGNAWKYTGKAAQPSISVHAGEIDGRPCICVADNGAGFDMAHRDQLFQPFRRLHRQEEFPGIGIGLATVQRIVHRHGGEIRAQAAPEQGATFCFWLGGGGGSA